MSIVFSAGEVINVAIGIEKRGITFYDIMARSTDDAQAREVFEGLLEMEREHLKTFQEMLREAGGQPPPEATGQEYSGYFQALVDNGRLHRGHDRQRDGRRRERHPGAGPGHRRREGLHPLLL